MSIEGKQSMRPNTLCMPFTLFSLSLIILLRFNPEIRRFVYSAIRWEECEDTMCSSLPGEYIIDAYRLISVRFSIILDCLIWWLCPSLRYPSPVDGIGASDQASVPCHESVSSSMPLVSALGSDPGSMSWGTVSSECSSQASLELGACLIIF